MATQFTCKNPGRRRALLDHKKLNGIDFLEVVSADQRTLEVSFLFPLPPAPGSIPAAPALTKDNVRIEGGVRIRNVRVTTVSSAANVLTVTVDGPGDFSNYTLRLTAGLGSEEPPAGFDPQMAAVEFTFKATCPSEFDCRDTNDCAPEAVAEPEVNYLARDYASFRRLMLDRMSLTMPAWRERSPADLGVTLVEMLAYTADRLAYYQDAVATEAYLTTARQRVSVRRHARLLDYTMHDGCNARAWVHLKVAANGGGNVADQSILPAGTPLLLAGAGASPVVDPLDLPDALRREPLAFETMHPIELRKAHNEFDFYTWNDTECCLPAGATRATLLNDPDALLQAGDFLLLEETVSPETGSEADADPAHRHVVRLTRAGAGTDPLDATPIVEVEWSEADALPFPLCLTSRVSIGGQTKLVRTSVARGNVVLADAGSTTAKGALIPPEVPEGEPYRPRVQEKDVTFRVPWSAIPPAAPATGLLRQEPREALPAIELRSGADRWTPRPDLLASDRFATHFVVEVERDGAAFLRFGDDVLGRRPSPRTQFQAAYRLGNGAKGNVGAEAIGHVVWNKKGVTLVRNPLPAAGGVDPEPIEDARRYAPFAFRRQERAVTAADYAARAEMHPGVQKAAAQFRWTGSWYTVFLNVDRRSNRDAADPAFQRELLDYLEPYRTAGHDIAIRGPVFVPLDLALLVCAEDGYTKADVKQRVLDALSSGNRSGGGQGFFHPDRFTFGQPVFLSHIYEAVLAVPGVRSVEVKRFQRWGRPAAGEKAAGVIVTAPLEIVRLDNSPDFPENGKIDVKVGGGL